MCLCWGWEHAWETQRWKSLGRERTWGQDVSDGAVWLGGRLAIFEDNVLGRGLVRRGAQGYLPVFGGLALVRGHRGLVGFKGKGPRLPNL